jgi:hypothetical protein
MKNIGLERVTNKAKRISKKENKQEEKSNWKKPGGKFKQTASSKKGTRQVCI